MIKYVFTGHLTPRPAGTERAMCGLTGEVYLASDVEAWQAAIAAQHQRQIAEFEARIRKLTFKNMNFRKRKRPVSQHGTERTK